jgi:hypothetical protein
MKTIYFLLPLLFHFGFGFAQTDSTKSSSIDNKVQQTNQVRKEQNRQATQTLKQIDKSAPQSVTLPEAAPSTPSAAATSTNNGNNKASGNSQPSTTPDASNNPGGTISNPPPSSANPSPK